MRTTNSADAKSSFRRCEQLWDAGDHDFRGFHERGGGLPLAELHLAGRVGGDDGSDALVADGEDDLGQQAAELDFDDSADEAFTWSCEDNLTHRREEFAERMRMPSG